MEPVIFLKGFSIGLLICAPLGPIGILCVRRTLLEGRLAGIFSVLGASTADIVFCTLAGLGITYISNFLRQEKVLIELIGGLILVLLGIKIFLSRPADRPPDPTGKGLLDAFSSTLFLTLANPMPILFLSAAFAALGVHGWQGAYLPTVTLIMGVFAGSALWAPILVALVRLIKFQFTHSQMRILNRISGTMIFAFGVGLGLMTLLK